MVTKKNLVAKGINVNILTKVTMVTNVSMETTVKKLIMVIKVTRINN